MLHLGVALPAHVLHGDVHVGGVHLDVVHPDQLVALADPGFFGRCVLKHLGDGDDIGFIIAQKLQAYAGVHARVVFPQVAPRLFVVIECVRIIARREHALHRELQHFVAVHFLVVHVFDVFLYRGQLFKLRQALVFLPGQRHVAFGVPVSPLEEIQQTAGVSADGRPKDHNRRAHEGRRDLRSPFHHFRPPYVQWIFLPLETHLRIS